MAFFDELRADYNRLNDPNYLQELTSRNQALYQPQLQRTFSSIDADLNRRGLFSASPVSRGRFQAGASFNTEIAKLSSGQIEQRRQQILPLLVALEQGRISRAQAARMGLFKFLGTALGTAGGFALGGPAGAIAGAGAGSSLGDYGGGNLV